MDLDRLTNGIKDVATVRQVYGEPYEKGDVTVVPVAAVYGGGGGGSGTQSGPNDSEQNGSGAGLGFVARPAGVYVITGDDVTWKPALNVNLIIAGGQLLALAVIMGLRRSLRNRKSS